MRTSRKRSAAPTEADSTSACLWLPHEAMTGDDVTCTAEGRLPVHPTNRPTILQRLTLRIASIAAQDSLVMAAAATLPWSWYVPGLRKLIETLVPSLAVVEPHSHKLERAAIQRRTQDHLFHNPHS
ncbi:hypothetical protein SDRG_12987 [Saprolegnia diclina VS20]|uniref:Uncharacterized protein n=1 Tax=Saprolegnia diclina (strain VS20) TaxID=1156394 RepID=T0RAU3_SAPDV|nr:hypothetical protein SDRG_12987 [Saprolegnia diclina VS20]EQC29318.1 hypothetical protein SDRG_12987 [Saprolegnia diclina VS20]|eukprot:XP_008617292.1 hypothetical protein SDRG_12987 [Saprolegnia diclina VS20]